MQSFGDKTIGDGPKTIGIGVPVQGENLKLRSNEIIPTRVCIMPKRSAIQLRGPSPRRIDWPIVKFLSN